MSLSNLVQNMRLVSLPCQLLVILLLSLHAIETQAQSNEPQKTAEDEVIKVRSHLVNIDVMVKDKKGRYVTDLKAEDFAVFENGVAQKVDFFDPPIVSGDQTSQTKFAVEARSLTLRRRAEEYHLTGVGRADDRPDKYEASSRRNTQVHSRADIRH